jgi:hypothetical protein
MLMTKAAGIDSKISNISMVSDVPSASSDLNLIAYEPGYETAFENSTP